MLKKLVLLILLGGAVAGAVYARKSMQAPSGSHPAPVPTPEPAATTPPVAQESVAPQIPDQPAAPTEAADAPAGEVIDPLTDPSLSETPEV